MNKTFIDTHARALCSLMLLSLPFVACAPSTVRIANTQTVQKATIQTQTSSPPSSLVFSSITGDAGNFALQAGETITFTWQNAPAGADRYEFTLVPHHQEIPYVLGTDVDASDGVAVFWTVPEHLAADLHATAYFSDGRKIEAYETFSPAIYSGGLPPAGVCSLIARHQPVEVYRLPDRTAEIFAQLLPGVYARVLETAPDGWYHIDASAAELHTPSRGDFRDVTVSAAMNSEFLPASGDGWVNNDKGVLLAGDCP